MFSLDSHTCHATTEREDALVGQSHMPCHLERCSSCAAPRGMREKIPTHSRVGDYGLHTKNPSFLHFFDQNPSFFQSSTSFLVMEATRNKNTGKEQVVEEVEESRVVDMTGSRRGGDGNGGSGGGGGGSGGGGGGSGGGGGGSGGGGGGDGGGGYGGGGSGVVVEWGFLKPQIL